MKKYAVRSVLDSVKLAELDLPQDLKVLTYSECRILCREIRARLIKTVSRNGGHLASNLGTVELSMAIHRVFNSPSDKIVWDVGHQAYTHKILTGRLKNFTTLRKEGGLSGFPKPSESQHDAFISGHSSTSISACCGLAEGMRLKGLDDNYAVAVIGDGAFTGGMAYEGLNNAGKSNTNLIVILNHNNMSISKNVGALSKYLSNIRGKQDYVKTKFAVEKTLSKTPIIGQPMVNIVRFSKKKLRNAVTKNTFFEDLGFIYLGPVDGHNQEEIEEVLKAAQTYKRPVFIHVNTVKGKGYSPAEKNPGEFHGISRFDIKTGNPEASPEDSFSTIFGKELLSYADKDKSICAVTAAMKYGTGLQYFYMAHKDRFFDVGIAEQHGVTFSAGLSRMGMIPVFAVYSSFIQRAYDQLIHDCAICKEHIVIGIDRAGIVGDDGETHQGMFDVPMLTSIPHMTIYSPSSYNDLKLCLPRCLYEEKGLVALRYPRGNDCTTYDKSADNGDYNLSIHYSSVLIIAYGKIYDEAYMAREILENSGICYDLLKLTRIFPISSEIISKVIGYKKIIFFEECFKSGSISEHFASILLENGYNGKYKSYTINDFVKQAAVVKCLEQNNLTSEKMVDCINKFMEK